MAKQEIKRTTEKITILFLPLRGLKHLVGLLLSLVLSLVANPNGTKTTVKRAALYELCQ